MLAQSGISFLIYLVAGIVWLVSNLMQQKKAKEKAEEMKRRREEREREEKRTGRKPERRKQDSIENELEAFLGRLAGGPQPEPEPRPSVTRPEPRRSEPVREPEPIAFDHGYRPDSTPSAAIPDLPEARPGKKIKEASKIEDMDMSSSFKEIKELKEVEDIIKDLKDGDQLRHEALRGVRSMMIDLSNTTITMPTLPIRNIRAVQTETSHPDLRNKERYRKALISTVLLENPKALQPRPFEGTS